MIVELREWLRLSEDLTRERVRLANRMREQLWRYYPQFLHAVDADVAAALALNLWRNLPTPRAGQRIREVTLARVLKQHRIRRIAAARRCLCGVAPVTRHSGKSLLVTRRLAAHNRLRVATYHGASARLAHTLQRTV